MVTRTIFPTGLKRSTEGAKNVIATEGGIPCIISTMNANPMTRIQQSGCGILWNLALNGMISVFVSNSIPEANRTLITVSGGIQCILNAMKLHATNTTLQGNACGALWNLALDRNCPFGLLFMTSQFQHQIWQELQKKEAFH